MFYGSSGSGSYASYQNPDFVPMFVAEFKNNATQQAAQTLCGSNAQCLLDYATTGNAQFANATLNIDKTIVSTNKLFGR